MYPANNRGDKIKQYQTVVAQHGWNKVTADAYEKEDNLFIQKEYNPQTNKYIISYGDRSQPKSIGRVIIDTEKEADEFIKGYINKDKGAVQQDNIPYNIPKESIIDDPETVARIDAMAAGDKLIKRVRKKHTFKICPKCGSESIGIVDLRPLGHKKSSICRECSYTL